MTVTRHRKGIRTRVTGAAIAVGAAAALAIGGGSAAAAPPDAFFQAQAKNTFVSFSIASGSNEISNLGYTALKLPCAKGKKLHGMVVGGDRTAPIQMDLTGAQYFESFWLRGIPDAGGIAGKIGATKVKGSLSLHWSRKVDHKTVPCSTGHRSWTAKQVSEDAWLAARKKQDYSVPSTP